MKWIILASVLFFTGCNQQSNSVPRVMIVGDSLSSYTHYVEDELQGRYDVFHAEGAPGKVNDRASTFFLYNINRIMADAGYVDIIHANWGMWDITHTIDNGPDALPDGCSFNLPPRTSLEQYRNNLEAISAVFEKTGARVIFATTTPVPEGNRCILPSDVVSYNKVIIKVAKEHGFGIDDLYTLMLPYDSLRIGSFNAHFTSAGYQLMSYQVSQSIEN